VVAQPRRTAEAEGEEAQRERPTRSEAQLRGRLNNDSLTEDELKQIEEERERAEEIARLREEDYQLAYAVDILRGLSVMGNAAK
jgi:carboxyl-terminal processing protease